MFDIGAAEVLLIAVVAILVIGPKDMPLALRTAGRWLGKVRRVSGHFRTGVDAMIREAELEDLEKKWASQNEKIKKQYPDGGPEEMQQTGAYPAANPAEKTEAGDVADTPAATAESAVAQPPTPAADPASGDDSKKADG